MKTFWITLGLFIFLIVLAVVFCPQRELHTEIRIDAPPSRVWAVLTDTRAYGEWNPFIVSVKGDLITGATLENTMRSDGSDRESSTASTHSCSRPMAVEAHASSKTSAFAEFSPRRLRASVHHVCR